MEDNKGPIEKKEEASSSLTKLDTNLNVVDSVLDKVGKIIKKRWWVILLLAFGYVCYWFFTMLDKEMQQPVIEQVQEYPEGEIEGAYYEEDVTLDTIFYDDGTYELQPSAE